METEEREWYEFDLGERVDTAEGRLGELVQRLSGEVTWDEDDDLVYLVGTTGTGRSFQLDVSLEDARVVLRMPVRRGAGWAVLRYHDRPEGEEAEREPGGDRLHMVAAEVACPVSVSDRAEQLGTLDALPPELRDRLFALVRELAITEWILGEETIRVELSDDIVDVNWDAVFPALLDAADAVATASEQRGNEAVLRRSTITCRYCGNCYFPNRELSCPGCGGRPTTDE